MGLKVAVLMNSFFDTGKYEMRFIAKDLSSDIYLAHTHIKNLLCVIANLTKILHHFC